MRLALLIGLLCTPALAAPFPQLLYAAEGAGKVLRYGPDGAIAWQYPAAMCRDAWQLPNGNVLFCYNDNYNSRQNDNPSGVIEVTPDKKVVFHFKTTGQVWSCQRLPDGNTMVGAASQGKLLIVSPKGEIVREIQLKNKPGHSCIRNARQIKNGNFLVAEENAKTVREYAPDGKLLREIKVNFAPYSAVRLDNGNTLICGQLSMVEIDPADKTTWSIHASDIPDLGIRWFAGIQVLPNGDIFVCNAGGKTTFFQLTRDKKVAWNSGPTKYPIGHGIQLLDLKDAPLK